MENIFLKILNICITASWLVLAVLLMRLVLKKAPKFLSVIMWALVGIRLVLPFSFESALSLIPSTETVPPEILYEKAPEIHTGIDIINSAVNPVISESFAPAPGASVNPLQVITYLAGWIWLVGMAGMAIYTLVSCLRIRHKLREAAPLRENIYLCDRIDTPFIFGIFRPKIYLPSAMDGADIPFVLAHEKAHLKRRDHLWKPLGFLLLTVYWFNPLLWLAYILLCRDIEAACDEKVLSSMGDGAKKPYSTALVNCSVPRKMIAACPLAFGEVNVKSRIKKVLSYKKPAFWLLIAAVIVCIALSVCFLTNPRTVNEQMQIFLDCTIADHFQTDKSQGNACCLDYQILGTEKKGKNTTVYMWVLYEEYIYANGKIEQDSGSHIVTAITATKEGGNYRLTEYWEPRDGGYYTDDIKAKFPMRLWLKALDSQRYIKRQKAACLELAEQYFKENPPTQQPSVSVMTPHPYQDILDSAHGLIDTITFDVDGDGIQERCQLHYGPTSGLFTIILAAYENGQLEYCNTFLIDHGDLSFHQTSDGKLGLVLDPSSAEDYRVLYDIAVADGNLQLLLGNTPVTLWGPQGPDAVVYDDWGLGMRLVWENGNVVNAVFEYTPTTSLAHFPSVSEAYQLYVIHEGKRWPFEDYVRKVLGQDYPAPEPVTQWSFYTIKAGETTVVPIDLDALGMELPAGTYELTKEVHLQIGDTRYRREYSARFAILEETDYQSDKQEIEDTIHDLQQDYTELHTDDLQFTVSYAGGDSELLSALAAESLNAQNLATSNLIHLPVLKFDTRKELEDFCWKYVNVISHSADSWDGIPYFQTLAAQFDEAFFRDNTLVLIYVPCSNCTHRFDVFNVFYGRDAFMARIYETTGASVVDDAEANWFITVALRDTDAEKITTYDAVLYETLASNPLTYVDPAKTQAEIEEKLQELQQQHDALVDILESLDTDSSSDAEDFRATTETEKQRIEAEIAALQQEYAKLNDD